MTAKKNTDDQANQEPEQDEQPGIDQSQQAHHAPSGEVVGGLPPEAGQERGPADAGM